MGVSLICSLVYLVRQFDPPGSTLQLFSKTASNGTLAVAAVATGAPWSLCCALAISSFVDWMITRRHDMETMVRAMAVQSCSYLLIIVTMLSFWAGVESAALASLCVLLFCGAFFIMMDQTENWNRYPAIGFVVVVAMLLFCSLGVNEAHRLATFGGILLAISAALLAYEQFFLGWPNPEFRAVAVVIWSTYHGAMLLFLFAFAV